MLKNLRKASTRFHTEERLDKCSSFFSRNLCSPVASRRPLSQRSLKLLAHVKNNLKPRAPSESPSEPLPSPDSRSSCDGWRPKPRHGSRCGCRRTACAPTQPAHPVKLAKKARKRAQRRWRRAAHAICLAGACSCTLGDAPVGRLCHARQRVLQGQPFHVPSASRFSAAWPERLR